MKRYENSIRVITAFFGVLLGFGLKRLLDANEFEPNYAKTPCFLLAVFLFLRLLLGSANHMWYEYVLPDAQNNSNLKGELVGKLKYMPSDFIFLILFGLIGISICYSTNLTSFLFRNLLLECLALSWIFYYRYIICYFQRRQRAVREDPWAFWLPINVQQFIFILSALLLYCWGLGYKSHELLEKWLVWNINDRWKILGPVWDIPISLLLLGYFYLFILDLWNQLQNLKNKSLEVINDQNQAIYDRQLPPE